MRERGKGIKARALRVRVPIEEIGFFNSLIDGLDRLALCRTFKKGEGIVDVIAPPSRFDELFEVVEGMKKHVRGLEVVGEVSEEDLNY